MDFLLTMDTEWDRRPTKDGRVTVENLAALPLFHALCVSEGIRPCYLCAQEAADAPVFAPLGERVVARNEGEIGTHLHPMTSPPYWIDPVEERKRIPFPTEYPLRIFEAKLAHLRESLEARFGPQHTYRAGRFGLAAEHVPVLLRHGFRIDSSVTPGVSWSHADGLAPAVGPDYTGFDAHPFWWDADEGGSRRLLELPVTIVNRAGGLIGTLRRWAGSGTRSARPVRGHGLWLRPMPGRLHELRTVARVARRRGIRVLNLMMHSNELHPACNPYFDTPEKVENLLAGLRTFFRFLNRRGVRHLTPREYAEQEAGAIVRSRPALAAAQGSDRDRVTPPHPAWVETDDQRREPLAAGGTTA
jgi:hypothetical protein